MTSYWDLATPLDRGWEFESQLLKTQEWMTGVDRRQMSRYHPQASSLERFIAKLLHMWSTFEERKRNWSKERNISLKLCMSMIAQNMKQQGSQHFTVLPLWPPLLSNYAIDLTRWDKLTSRICWEEGKENSWSSLYLMTANSPVPQGKVSMSII